MKLGTCAYSYRDLLTKGKMTLIELLDTVRDLGFDGIEWTAYYFPETTKEYLLHIKRETFVRGLDISATAVGGNFIQPTREEREKQIANVKSWIEKSAWMGSTALRVFAGYVTEGMAREDADQMVRDGLAECARLAEKEGVILALENHGGVTADAEGTVRLVKPLNNPWVKLNLDFGNFTGDIYAQYEACAPYAVTTHTKVTVRQGEAREKVDYRKVVRIMRNAGYRGYINIEFEEPEDPIVGVDRFAAYLRGCMEDA
ncbi:MAG TPA: sugar phosphate isomerase/epimerase family protein [Candidatus Latescibacteria bacterium]|nr:sugar phosphate isomerase/epimerase family protein [Candidatus Latescibacterota bacterium]